MKNKTIILSVIAITALLFVASASQSGESKIAPLVFASAGEDGKIPVIIVLKEQPQLKGMVRAEEINNLKSHAESTQRTLMQALRQEEGAGNAKDIKNFYVVNAIAVKATLSTIKKLAQRSDVDRIEPDVRVTAVADNPFDNLIKIPPLKDDKFKVKDIIRDYTPVYPNETAWGVNWTEAPQLWERGINGSGVNVSIIDSGIYPHQDIAGKIIAFKDFVNNNNTPYDDNGHGTHVAGTVAGDGKRGVITGVAPGANLMGVKVLNQLGYGNASDVIAGLEWSYNNRADIVSLSLGFLPLDGLIYDDIATVGIGGNAKENITVYSNDSAGNAFKPAFIMAGVVLWENNSVWVSDTNGATLQRNFDLTDVTSATLNFKTLHYLDFEEAHVQVLDGPTWVTLATYKGDSFWKNESIDLSAYAGKNITLRFHLTSGFWQIDDIAIPQIPFYDDVENGSMGWVANGWVADKALLDAGKLDISLKTPGGVKVYGNSVNWQYYNGVIPQYVWIYKYNGTSFLEAGNWSLEINNTHSRDIFYSGEIFDPFDSYYNDYLFKVGYPSDGTDATSLAINNIAGMGVVPVVAAGNKGWWGLYSISSPGSASQAITAGATDYRVDYIADFSSRGPVNFGVNKTIKPDVVAPGVNIISLNTAQGYSIKSGTSMATPHVAGAVALMLQRNSSLTPADVKRILEQSAIDLGAPGKDNTYGAGRISAYAAAANSSSSPLPPVIPKQMPSKHELFAGAAVDDVYVKPFITDAVGDAEPAVDIRGVEAYTSSNYVYFYIYTSGKVNLSTSEFYLDLDTDRNSTTGAGINDIGADYRIKLNGTNGYMYRMNGSQEEFVQYISRYAYDRYVYTYLYLPSIGQTSSNVSFFGVARSNTDTAPDTGHGIFPYADIQIRMVGISWNDETGAPQAGTNITFRVYQGYPYYSYVFNSTVQTNSSGMAVADYTANQTWLYGTYYVDIWDDRGNFINDYVYANAYVPYYYQYEYPFQIPKWNDYYAVRNSTLPVKLTMVTPEWNPYNNNVTLVFGYPGSTNVSAYLKPTQGTIEYDLNLANTSIDEYYSYIPVYVLNGTLSSYDYSRYVGYLYIRHPNDSTVSLNPWVYSAAPDEKLDFLVETRNPYLETPTSRRLDGIAYWIKEVDVKALGEKVSPAVLVKIDEMRKSTEQGEYKDLLSKEEKDELKKALSEPKNIGINYSFFDVFTDATGIAKFNVTVPQEEQKVYFGYVCVGYDDITGYDWDCSFVFVKEPDWRHHPGAPQEDESRTYLSLRVDWNAHKTGDEWAADNNFTVNLRLQEYNYSTGWRYVPNEEVRLYTTTRDTKTVTTDINGSAKINFTAPAVDIKNSTWAERCVQVWGITGLLQYGIAVADDGWGCLYIPGEYNRTPVTLSISDSNLQVLVKYQNRTKHPVTNVPSVLDVQKSPYYWWGSTGDLVSEYVKSSTDTYQRIIPLTSYGTYSAMAASEYRYYWDYWHSSYTRWGDGITYHPFNITTEVSPRYPRNITRPITVNVRDANGTPMPGVSVYIAENSYYWYEGGSGSNLLWGHIDVNKTDATGKATLMLKTPDVNNAWVYYRIGGATENFSMPYIRSGHFQVKVANKSDLKPVIDMPSVVEAGKETIITGRVYNNGDIPSNASFLSLYVDNVLLLPNISVGVIQPYGNYTSFSRAWTPVNAISYEIKAVADATNTNDEANEEDNIVKRSVSASLPDLKPTITVPAKLQLGSTADIGVVVRNIGGITAPASTLLVQINNANFNTSTVPSILPGEMHSVHMNWTPAIVGTYTIKAISDATGIINELDEDNNVTPQVVVNVYTLPDLTVTLTVPSEVRVNTSAYILARVSNLGSLASNATKLSIYDGATLLENVSVPPLNASESRDYNVAWTPITTGPKQIRAIIDPDDTTKESNEANNVDIKASSARFTDLAVIIQSRNEVILNSTETIRVIVRNQGTMASEPTNLTTTIINTTLVELINTTVTVPSIAPGDTRVFSAAWNANEPGVHTVRAALERRSSDTNPANDNATRVISVKGYNINVWHMWYPYYYPVYEDNHFYIAAYVDADYAGSANASISFEPASGLNATMPNKTFTLYNSTHNYIWWLVRADNIGKYNATITVSGFNETSEINTTHDKTSQIRTWWNPNYTTTYHQRGPINVIAQTVVVKDLNWTIPPLDGDDSRTLSYQVFNVTEIEKPSIYYWVPAEPNRSLKIDVSAGAEGRLLIGLEYLFGYPHGCPEQAMSPTLGAKRVEQYYLKRDVLISTLNATLYDKVKKGVNMMSPNSTANPQQIPGVGTGTGGWAWGTGTPSMFYTVYTHYGMGVILNNTNYSHLVYNANINVNESARWIVNNPNDDGSWTGRGYISGNVPFTGFAMIALEQTLPYMNATMYNRTNNSLQNATAYLLRKQMSNGGWNQRGTYGQADGYSTSLALLGLIDSGNNSAPVQQAISNGTGWLIANKNIDGSWSKYGGSQSYSYYGDLAETTAYAAVALNKSGNNSAAVINAAQNGLRYLVGVYQDKGSWGSTKSSQTAIYALTELQVPEDIDTNVTIVLKDVINQSIRLNNSNPAATISSLPKPYLIRDRIWIQINRSELNAIGIGNHTINITTNGNAKVLVGVESKQNALKREAFEKVPWQYIDPIADNFTLALSLPSGIKDGDSVTANATINNIDNTTGLYVMILEVPLSSNVTFPNTYPENTTYYNNSGNKVLVQNMYNASENKLYIYPGSDNESQPSVPAGESRSFYFNITMLGYGQQTIESKVVPMYNDTLMAIANVTTTVIGYGNVTVNTIDVNDSSITANVTIDSTSGTTARELEGSYSLNATKAGFIPVNTTVSIAPGSDRIYTAKLVENASEPVAVFYETNTTALPANVSGVVTKVYNFTVQSNGGKTIIALQIPANHTLLSAAVNGVSASARNESGMVYVEAELTGDSVFEVRFKAPVSTFNIQTAGPALNLIGLPVDDSTVLDANSLRSKSGASFVARWNTSASKYDIFAGLAKDNFLIRGGDGYFVYTAAAQSVSFIGKAWGDGVFTVELKEGLNLVSVPLKDATVTDANSLRSKSGASFVARWNTSASKYDVFAGLAKDNFLIRGEEGYFVYRVTPTNVTFTGEAWSN